jgi:hypothetical protein
MKKRRKEGRRGRPRYFLTVQVAQSLEEEAEAAGGGGGGSGVGPVAYEFTLENIELLDTVATLRAAIAVGGLSRVSD